MRKDVKIGVVAGDEGTDGVYQWNVLILDRAYGEAMKILSSGSDRGCVSW